MTASADAIFASLAGSAIGDALGLPYENLSARRAARLLGEPDRFRFALGRGMVSDDAEHACMTAAAFAASGGDVDRFRRDLARRLRWWLLTIPPGIGLATLKSIGRLWLGWPATRSGVRSAGNGPAMRSAVLGRLFDPATLFAFVAASSQITHRDPRATLGAYAVAVASRVCAEFPTPGQSVLAPPRIADAPDPGWREDAPPRREGATTFDAITDAIMKFVEDDDARRELLTLLDRVAASLDRGESTEAFADSICRKRGRVSGFIYETVPVALHAAFAQRSRSTRSAPPSAAAGIRTGSPRSSAAFAASTIRVARLSDRVAVRRRVAAAAVGRRRESDAAAAAAVGVADRAERDRTGDRPRARGSPRVAAVLSDVQAIVASSPCRRERSSMPKLWASPASLIIQLPR